MASRVVSYAQNGEDMVLRRAFPDRSDGFYVDLGANDPVTDSVTKHFYDRGWRGVNVEPVPEAFAALESTRPEDVNLNVAVGTEHGTVPFYIAPNTGLSSFSLQHILAQGYGEADVTIREIPVLPLQEIFDAHVKGRQVDFLKVDVEGAEDAAVLSLDWSRWRPRILVLEAFYFTRDDVLRNAGYRKTLWDGINSFWVREEDADELATVLSYPASTVLDAYDPWHYVHQILKARENSEIVAKPWRSLWQPRFSRRI
jgi:FkbM family methyltransferase